MEEIILEAMDRIKKNGKSNPIGIVSGVIYGDEIENSLPVSFDEKALIRILSVHGSRAKINVRYKDKISAGFIKEVQRQPLSGKIIHLDLQVVSKEHEVKRQIPIMYAGEDDLKKGLLEIHANKSEVTVFGKMAFMPENIEINVADMKMGDTITYETFKLDSRLKNEDGETIYAFVSHIKNQLIEEPEATEEVKAL